MATTKARSASRASRGTSAASPPARRSASSSSTRNWRWCRCCRSPRTCSWATSRGAGAWWTATPLSKEVKLLILDEPTASLNETDSQALLDLLLELKAQGIACILISHKLNEVERVADTITVLRDGSTVQTFDCRAQP